MFVTFPQRLAEQCRERKNPVVVGLDPRWGQLPASFRSGVAEADLRRMAAGYLEFCRGVIDVVAAMVPAVKPQCAFFEQIGPDGMTALHEVIRYARSKGLVVILDAKRNDIGSTAQAYAEGMLGSSSPWGADALTVSPYLGDDSLDPFVQVAKVRDAGLFILVKTSNPGGGLFQDLEADGRAIYEHVAEYVERVARSTCDPSDRTSGGYGLAGAVVGATYPEQLGRLRATMPHAWLLVPGYGSQGGTARDVAGAFDERGFGAVVNNSRGIIFAHARREYAERFGERNWQGAVEQATRDMIDELRGETSVGRLASG